MSNIVAVVTDFGINDGSAACMEAVILAKNPMSKVIHISHAVPSWDISVAAMFLEVYYKYYPKSTVFVAVIDPGVGTNRKPIAIKVSDYFFVGPDNGIFDLVIKQNRAFEVIQLDNPKFWLPEVSTTFHGRDIFAPVAAHLAQTLDISELGSKVPSWDLTKLDPLITVMAEEIISKVLYIDDFGNLVLGVTEQQFEKFVGDKQATITIMDSQITRRVETFAELSANQLGLIFGGDFGNYGTIAMKMGNAAKKTKAAIGTLVRISTN